MAAKKKAAPKKSKKNVEKKKKGIVEDKTFGLKNKNKSKKVQRFVQQVHNQVEGGSTRDKIAEKFEARKTKKQQKAVEAAEMATLLSLGVVQPKLAFGTDPKSVLCVHFKIGKCTKGKKCKYSHDLNVGKKKAKRSANVDIRDKTVEKEDDTMDKWDEDKLKKVVQSKGTNSKAKPTEIVCKYFLEALDNEKYGWFWTCPNGGDKCKYRHALPEGFQFKTKRERDEERALFLENGGRTGKDIFEVIEEKRAALPTEGLTPVTAESLAKWKEDRKLKEIQLNEEKRKAEAKKTGGKGLGVLSGRALFMYDPTMFADDPTMFADDPDASADNLAEKEMEELAEKEE